MRNCLSIMLSVAPLMTMAATWNGETVREEPCRVSAMPFNRVWPGYQRSLDQTKLASFVSFDVERPGEFSWTLPKGVTAARIRPFRREQGKVEDGVLKVRIEHPEQFVIESGGTELMVFADPPWTYKAKPGDRYFGPGEHEAGAIIPKNGERIVLDRGAVVYGNFVFTGVTNVTVEGRGILDTSRIRREQPDWPGVRHLATCGIRGIDTVWGTTPVYANRCAGLSLSGIVFRDAPRWTMNIKDSRDIAIDGVKLVGMWRYNSDGIDICACEKTVIRNSFIRSFDDCVIARPQLGAREMTPLQIKKSQNEDERTGPDANRRECVADTGSDHAGVKLSDVGEIDCIHPGDKRTVGTRLAAMALNRLYGFADLTCDGPTFRAAIFSADGRKVTLSFDHVTGWCRKGAHAGRFELAGADGRCVPVVCHYVAKKPTVDLDGPTNMVAE